MWFSSLFGEGKKSWTVRTRVSTLLIGPEPVLVQSFGGEMALMMNIRLVYTRRRSVSGAVFQNIFCAGGEKSNDTEEGREEIRS